MKLCVWVFCLNSSKLGLFSFDILQLLITFKISAENFGFIFFSFFDEKTINELS